MKDWIVLGLFMVMFVGGFAYIAKQSVGLQQNIYKIVSGKR